MDPRKSVETESSFTLLFIVAIYAAIFAVYLIVF